MIIRFEDPQDGASFTAEDDIDPFMTGVQIKVRLYTEGLTDEDVVSVLQNDVSIGEKMAAETVEFDMTLSRGTNVLQISFDGDLLQEVVVELRDPCGSAAFVLPEPPPDGEDLVLGGSDGFCEGEQTIDVVATVPDVADGTEVMLLVDGSVKDTAEADRGRVRFEDVVVGTSSSGVEMAVRIAGNAGDESCGLVAYPARIIVDCEGPDCQITDPDVTGTLTATDDTDPSSPGLQLPVEVTTSRDAEGRVVRVLVDGESDDAYEAMAAGSGSQVVAKFPEIELSSGQHTLRAECTDAQGNLSFDERTWTVDVDACAIEITEVTPTPGAGGVLIADAVGEPLTVTLAVTVAGDDCSELRAAVAADDSCSGVGSVDPVMLTPGDAGAQILDVELRQAGEVRLCAQVRDESGNDAVDSYPVTFVNGTPQLQLALSDAYGDKPPHFNKEGRGDRIADGDPATDACEADMTVRCEGPDGETLEGIEVRILQAGNLLELASAACEDGVATFSADAGNPVRLPTVNDTDTEYTIVATTEVGGITGESAPLAVKADCVPPSVSFISAYAGSVACDGVIRPADDPSDTLVVIANSAAAQQPEVTLRAIRDDGSDFLDPPRVSSVRDSINPNWIRFDDVDFTAAGELDLEACTFDLAQNAQCTSSCPITSGEVPSLTVAMPAMGSVLRPGLDGVDYRSDAPAEYTSCSSEPGFWIRVTASTDVMDGTDVAEIKVGAQDPVRVDVSGGAIDACVPADTNGPVNVAVTVDNGAFPYTVTRRVTVDTQPPAEFAAEAASPCRGPAVLEWEPATPADSTLAGYEVRCAADPDPSTIWDNPERTEEAPAGATQVAVHSAPGPSLFCVARSYDQGGAYSPLPATSAELTPQELSQWDLPLPLFEDTLYGVGVSAVGDVNGDGHDDFVVSGGGLQRGHAYLYFGREVGDGSTPIEPVDFVTNGPFLLGVKVRPLGNFDGDPEDTDDFAISAYEGNLVYVILGRHHEDTTAAAQWPTAPFPLDAGGCSADLCIAGDGNDFGIGLNSAGTFNTDDTLPDLALGSKDEDLLVVLGSTEHQRADFTQAGTGTCLDTRLDPSSSPASCERFGGPVIPRGFRIPNPERQEGETFGTGVYGVASTDNNDLWFANNGDATGVGARMHVVRGRAYGGGSGILDVPPSAVTTLPDELGLGRGLADLLPVTDLNGDGIADLLAVSAAAGAIRIYYGAFPTKNLAFSRAASLLIRSDASPELGRAFGFRAAPGLIPGRGSIADLTGDGIDEFVGGAGVNVSNAVPGVVDVIWGATKSVPTAEQTVQRNNLGSVGLTATRFDSAALGGPEPTPSPYPRTAAPIGDLDGDAFPDMAVVEYNPSGSSDGMPRVVVIGTCR